MDFRRAEVAQDGGLVLRYGERWTSPRIWGRLTYAKFAGNEVSSDEWIRILPDGRQVKFSHDELMDTTFLTAQIQGNEVVYSILLNKAQIKLSRDEVEGSFQRELSKK